jgi:hypothetical protein
MNPNGNHPNIDAIKRRHYCPYLSKLIRNLATGAARKRRPGAELRDPKLANVKFRDFETKEKMMQSQGTLRNVARWTASMLVAAGSIMLATGRAQAAADNFFFPLVVSSGAASCLPNATGTATVTSLGTVENLHVEVKGLPAKTDFDFFIIQVPNKPFGLSWYQGDIETDSKGAGVGDFTGRFNKETFIIAQGTAGAPVVFKNTPFPDVNTNPVTGPVHTYHVGLWFNSPADAAKAGCASTETPFNGEHNAGIQVINSSNFGDLTGPLRNIE